MSFCVWEGLPLKLGAIVFLCGAVAVPALVCAAVVSVPQDQPTLQQAIDSASPGDTVRVAVGRFVEKIKMKPGVSLVGSSTGPDSTILVSPGGAAELIDEILVECRDGVDSTVVIEGFVFDDGGFTGCAIFCENASPQIRRNMMRNFGWGLNLRFCNSIVEDNVIHRSRSFGVMVRGGSPRLYRNEIRHTLGAGIEIAGRKTHPLIGGSRENSNKIYGNTFAVRNGSVNDINATWNDWGWEVFEEMNREPYPSDVIAIVDGNDRGPSHRGRGKIDYQNWLKPSVTEEEASLATGVVTPAATPAPGDTADSPSLDTAESGNPNNAPSARPSSGSEKRIPAWGPIVAALLLAGIFVGLSRKKKS